MTTTRAAAFMGALMLLIGFALGYVTGSFAQTACQPGPKDPSGVYVDLANTTNREAIAHAQAAVVAGEARVLHWEPALAEAHRAVSLRGVPTWGQLSEDRRRAIDPEHFALSHDRDEYPPAASLEGGAGADVRYILSSDNRSAGSRMQAQMGGYCAGTRFLLEP